MTVVTKLVSVSNHFSQVYRLAQTCDQFFAYECKCLLPFEELVVSVQTHRYSCWCWNIVALLTFVSLTACVIPRVLRTTFFVSSIVSDSFPKFTKQRFFFGFIHLHIVSINWYRWNAYCWEKISISRARIKKIMISKKSDIFLFWFSKLNSVYFWCFWEIFRKKTNRFTGSRWFNLTLPGTKIPQIGWLLLG